MHLGADKRWISDRLYHPSLIDLRTRAAVAQRKWECALDVKSPLAAASAYHRPCVAAALLAMQTLLPSVSQTLLAAVSPLQVWPGLLRSTASLTTSARPAQRNSGES